jgi:hypothetical protein
MPNGCRGEGSRNATQPVKLVVALRAPLHVERPSPPLVLAWMDGRSYTTAADRVAAVDRSPILGCWPPDVQH